MKALRWLGTEFKIARFLLLLAISTSPVVADETLDGKFFRGRGDVEYLRLLDISRRMFEPDPEFQNLSMLYITNWNGFVEGPTWDAWWIQNSYGPTYSALPMLQEPYVTFLQNAQNLWFDQMGDGKRVGASPPLNWIAPDGCLCDAARPGWIVYRQGDGRIDIHDWAMEFTAAGILLQSELLLIGRDVEKSKNYLPRLERAAAFIETRRDTNDLFLAGPAANLLAPSYAGWRKTDGTYGKGYLTGLSITYIAALDRLIELEKFASRREQAKQFAAHRNSARKALSQVTEEEGYFIRSLDPDGVKHGIFGAKEHGYFETSPNHDAIAFRVVDDKQASQIFRKIESIPQLRPHSFIIPNYPAYDDMYEQPAGIWTYGTWVNGGHWSTCEARMMLGYYRLGKFEDARRSMQQLMKFARSFRMDNPLTNFGDDVYQPNEPINLCYDSFGPPAAFIRGLFEYIYSAEGLTLYPHIPPGISELEQKFPIRFGGKQIFLSTAGTGPIARVEINGRRWKNHDAQSIFLSHEKLPQTAQIKIFLGRKKSPEIRSSPDKNFDSTRFDVSDFSGPEELRARAANLLKFCDCLAEASLADSYEAAHAKLTLGAIWAISERKKLFAAGKLKPLSEKSQQAADKSYVDTAERLFAGLQNVVGAGEKSDAFRGKQIRSCWTKSFGLPAR